MSTLSQNRPPSSAVSRPVDATLSEIITLHGEIITAARTTLSKAIRIGELLTQQKAGLKHGEWLPWVKESLPFEQKTAWRYMNIYSRRDELGTMPNLELTDAYRLLAAPAKREEEPEEEPGVPTEATPAPWKCDSCEETIEDDTEAVSLYECEGCGDRFTREDSADGCSHRCPSCNKFGRKVTDMGCPSCGEGELTQSPGPQDKPQVVAHVEVMPDPEPPPAPTQEPPATIAGINIVQYFAIRVEEIVDEAIEANASAAQLRALSLACQAGGRKASAAAKGAA